MYAYDARCPCHDAAEVDQVRWIRRIESATGGDRSPSEECRSLHETRDLRAAEEGVCDVAVVVDVKVAGQSQVRLGVPADR
jgi:hypothetical protein